MCQEELWRFLFLERKYGMWEVSWEVNTGIRDEGAPAGQDTGEFLDDDMQFWLGFAHLLVWECLEGNQELDLLKK